MSNHSVNILYSLEQCSGSKERSGSISYSREDTMKSTTGFIRRIGTAPMRLAAALALLLVGAIAQNAGAAEMDQGQFKAGCESGGHSYVENRGGSFQCNLRSGGTIKCQDTHSPCTYTASISHSVIFGGMAAGTLEIKPAQKRSRKPSK
jgi:hypothetical protein